MTGDVRQFPILSGGTRVSAAQIGGGNACCRAWVLAPRLAFPSPQGAVVLLGIAGQIFAPPMSFLILALIGIVLLRWAKRLGWTLLGLGIVGLWVLAMPITSKALIAGLETNLPVDPPVNGPAPQAIVLLGGDMSRNAPPAPPSDVGALSLERERAAARLARSTGLPILITGGQLGPGSDPVSVLMARSLSADFAVSTKWLEMDSKTTWQNAELSATLLQASGIHSVFIVTHAWHMRRAVLAFRHFGLEVTAAPTQIHRRGDLTVYDLFPRATAWSDSYYALHEWIGYAYYALRS